MARSRFVIFALALLMSLSPVAASAHHDRPDRIDLPDGWMPEGITTDGRFLYSGSLADGALLRANPRTGNTRIIEEGRQGRVAVGVDYDRRRDLLWVAGSVAAAGFFFGLLLAVNTRGIQVPTRGLLGRLAGIPAVGGAWAAVARMTTGGSPPAMRIIGVAAMVVAVVAIAKALIRGGVIG